VAIGSPPHHAAAQENRFFARSDCALSPRTGEAAKQAAEKPVGTVILTSPPFLLADDEGSPQLLDSTTAEILRSAQNDSLEAFFRSL
jgi:hypothetical protein